MKHITQTFKTIVLALIFSLGISYVAAWTAPTSQPPTGNTSAPVNVSTNAQYKDGALGIGGVVHGYSNALFDGSITAPTITGSSNLCIGGDCRSSWPSGAVSGVASISQGTGITLSPNPITNTGTISVNTSTIQNRVTGNCPTGAIQTINTDGTVTCVSVGGGGGVTSVNAGPGISVNQTTGAVTVSNMGVRSLAAGSHIFLSGSTGAVTVSATGGTISLGTPFQWWDNNCNNGFDCICPAGSVQVGITGNFGGNGTPGRPVCSSVSIQ